MLTPKTPIHPLVIPALAIALAIPLAPTPASASHCCEDWDEPFICRLDFVSPDHLVAPAREGDPRTLRLAPGKKATVDVKAYDQDGKAFPGGEIRYQFPEDDCRGLVEAQILSREQFEVRAGQRSGACDLHFWVPGNRNLETTFRVEVGSVAAVGHRETIVARRLYQAILGREPSRDETRDLAGVIQRRETRAWVDSAFRSAEFQRNRASMGSGHLLQSFYQGLLGREPDPEGIQAYTPLLRGRRYAEIVMQILDSPELRASIEGELHD
jgi:hypothetical protein